MIRSKKKKRKKRRDQEFGGGGHGAPGQRAQGEYVTRSEREKEERIRLTCKRV